MKKIISMLSLAVVAASALLVSCAQGVTPTNVPAFPQAKTATYAPADGGSSYAWTFSSADKWTSANEWLGFEIKPDANPDKSLLNFYFEPNMNWTAKIVSGQEYLIFLDGYGYAESQYTETHTVNGVRGRRHVVLKPLKTPASGEEAVECKLELTMADQTMPLATIIIGIVEE